MYILICWSVAGRPGKSDLFLQVEVPILPSRTPRPEGRVKAAGCRVLSSATTVDEARWLETHGVDVIIAQGIEAGGHRGAFLSADSNAVIASQPGIFALVPLVADAVKVPVVAAGGIADARGIAARIRAWSIRSTDRNRLPPLPRSSNVKFPSRRHTTCAC